MVPARAPHDSDSAAPRIQHESRTPCMVTCYTSIVSLVRVAFVSPSGLGNLGDAAIIESFLAGLRRRKPGVEIVGFTLNPADTRIRHGVDATTCGAFSLPHYTIRRPPREAPGGSGESGASDARPSNDDEDDEDDEATPPLVRLRRAVAALPGARPGRRA